MSEEPSVPRVPLEEIPDEVIERIDGYVDKYMEILQVEGPGPVVEVVDSDDDWFGSVTGVGRVEGTSKFTTLIELQKFLLKDDTELEKTIAHEMVHHQNLTSLTKDELARLTTGSWEGPLHGASFLEGAARINAVMGAGFVTDEEPTKTSFSRKLMLALALGLAAFAGVRYIKRRVSPPQQPQQTPTTLPAGPKRPSRSEVRGENERGSYGKKPAPVGGQRMPPQAARENERGHYGKGVQYV